ncbi:MAG: primosomal protein N' [Mariprofundaceae bacterium]|nr:primosomal protein N' [Mariprofundaceae bacterium]
MKIQQDAVIWVAVAVYSPLRNLFYYRWPKHLGTVHIGLRVSVPLRRSERLGVIVSQSGEKPSIKTLDVLDVLDVAPLYDVLRQQWLQRLARYYLPPLGIVWETALAWASVGNHRRFRQLDTAMLAKSFPDLHQAFRRNTPLSIKTLRARCTSPYIFRDISQAVQQGALQEAVAPAVWLAENPCSAPPPTLNHEQQQALNSILAAPNCFHPVLLFGCTGSGKTEVYLNAARHCVQAGKQVLILVPEIGLTPMWQQRLCQRFDRVMVWHSALATAQRLAAISHLAEAEVLIGTRSALFLPLPRLGMIVIDEEHDTSFKQHHGLCYSARDAALLLAQTMKIPIIFGSATPSLESWQQVKQGRYERLDLTLQAIKSQPVAIKIVDMRQHKAVISPPLMQALKDTLDAGEQSILFLNRRGYAPALHCVACGDVAHCVACALRLTLHRKSRELRCHVCGYNRVVPRCCEQCGEVALLPMGIGTERLHETLEQHIPRLRLARFDRDMVTSHQRLAAVLKQFEDGDIDCLIGTQMLVKGHDFPNVTLVGVIHADMGLSLPDFRANERWWQQMTQVMGRAGRGHKAGRVLLQTWMPEAPWLVRMHGQSAADVLDEELLLRQQLQFPPFARWVRIVCSAQKEAMAQSAAEKIAMLCKAIPDITVMEAMPCALERQAYHYRFEVLLRDASKQHLPWKLTPVLHQFRLPSQVRCRIDVDPLDMG